MLLRSVSDASAPDPVSPMRPATSDRWLYGLASRDSVLRFHRRSA